jgi:DNA-binding NarL/FixJ family response regulator
LKILIVDDHALVAHGMQRLLTECDELDAVEVCSDGGRAVEEVERSAPDVVLLDINLGGYCGLSLAQGIKDTAPAPRIILISAYANPEFVLEALRSGVEGYLDKAELPTMLCEAARRVAAGERVFSESIARVATALVFHDERLIEAQSLLSPKEKATMQLTAQGASIKTVAEHLGVQQATVRTLLSRAHKKLGLEWNLLAGPSAAKLLRR